MDKTSRTSRSTPYRANLGASGLSQLRAQTIRLWAKLREDHDHLLGFKPLLTTARVLQPLLVLFDRDLDAAPTRCFHA
jgi:hypothetical protein